MASPTATSCPGGNSAVPALSTLPIPQDINVVVRTGTNTSNPAMSICCAPSRVQIVDGCYLWCEVPRRYFDGSTTQSRVTDAFLACIRAANRGRNATDESVITGWQYNTGARAAGTTATAKQMGLWLLLVSGLMIYVL